MFINRSRSGSTQVTATRRTRESTKGEWAVLIPFATRTDLSSCEMRSHKAPNPNYTHKSPASGGSVSASDDRPGSVEQERPDTDQKRERESECAHVCTCDTDVRNAKRSISCVSEKNHQVHRNASHPPHNHPKIELPLDCLGGELTKGGLSRCFNGHLWAFRNGFI